MRKLPKLNITFQNAYTLLEILIVLTIVGTTMSIVAYGVMKFRQTLLISNTAKEIILQLRKARRYAINNAATSDGRPSSGYYIYFANNDYIWGECYEDGVNIFCNDVGSVKSKEYSGIDVYVDASCGSTNVFKFNSVTGEFVFTDSSNKILRDSTTNSCKVIVSLGNVLKSRREIEISGESRTIKMI
jgi:prepilin-type N-terminal cleavage/methylation domain-containing protein